MANILYVEDDPTLRENFSKILSSEGFHVSAFSDEKSALDGYSNGQFDLALLDITLGNTIEGGFQLCTELRKLSEKLPIIFFTAHDNDFDKISGMRLGADDYITKDTNVNYLIVRIRALLRRIEVLSRDESDTTNNEIIIDALKFNMDSLTAHWNNEPLVLTLTQLWILHALTVKPGQVCSLQQLMEAAKITIQPNTVAAHIKSIRNEFMRIDPEFTSIKTERGNGYRWVNA